ncbi:MAG: hypothetical protein KKA31_00120, partial [Candidatus Margulisbacteria bacterium]|nr:hypothetical protein [Candidatus Margulisiibacteriota bacterium]
KKGLDKNLKLLIQDLRLKQAEILVWTKNFGPAKKLLAQIEEELKKESISNGNGKSEEYHTSKHLQKTRIQLAYGNIEAQWLTHPDYSPLSRNAAFEKALEYYGNAETIIKQLTDPDPGQEQILVTTELYLNLANVYRYGWGSIALEKAYLYYLKAEKVAKLIKGNKDLKNYHLARIYYGMAKIAEQDLAVKYNGKEYWAPKLSQMAEEHADLIVKRDKYAVSQMISELQINHQNQGSDILPSSASDFATVYSPNEVVGQELIPPTMNSRFSTRLTFPLKWRNFELDLFYEPQIDIDMNSGSTIMTHYLGTRIKPLSWLTFEAKFKPGTEGSHFLYKGQSTYQKYFNAPDMSLAVGLQAGGNTPFLQGLSATLATDLFVYPRDNENDEKYSKLSSFYANVFYNSGKDSTNPFLQGFSWGLEFNYFRFQHNEFFPKRYKLYSHFPLPNYTLDVKKLDTSDIDGLYYDMIKIGVELPSLVYEHAIDYSSGLPGKGNTTYVKENLGFSTGINLQLNLFHCKLKLHYRYEGMYQDVLKRYYNPSPWQNNHQAGFAIEIIP